MESGKCFEKWPMPADVDLNNQLYGMDGWIGLDEEEKKKKNMDLNVDGSLII
jgi:hypothetical protein